MYALHGTKTTIARGTRYPGRVLPIVAYVFAASAAAWIARFDLRTSNTRGVVFAMLLSTFVCSAVEARYATLWALLLGFAVPIAETYSAAAGAPRPGLGGAVSMAILSLITLAIAFTGAVIGVFFDKVIRRSAA